LTHGETAALFEMRFIFVNRFFGNPDTPTGRMLRDVAERLAADAHQVTVLVSSATYAGSRSGPAEPVAGVTIRRLPLTGGDRVASWIAFWIQAMLLVPAGRWDRCVLMTDPPFLCLAAPLAKLRKRERRVYWWTMDLYPEALAAGGVMARGGLVYRSLETLSGVGLGSIDGVIALGSRQLRRLKGYPHWRHDGNGATVIPPWDDRPLGPVAPNANRILARMGWRDKKVALYAGNLGQAHTFAPLVAAARALHQAGDNSWVFAFFCRGARREQLLAAARDLPNVVVEDYVTRDETPDLLHAATIHIVTMADGWEGVVVPSKLYGIMQTKSPVLFVGPADADTAVEVETLGLGQALTNDASTGEVLAALANLETRSTATPAPEGRGPSMVVRYLTAS